MCDLSYFKIFVALIGLGASGIFVGPSLAAEPKNPELIVYTYDSMVAKGGLGPEIFSRFEKKHGIRIKALAAGDAGQLLTRLQLDQERKKPTAHVVLGIDQNQWAQIEPLAEGWGGWKPKNFDRLAPELRTGLGQLQSFLPFDYGFFTFIADQKKIKELGLQLPLSLSALSGSEFRRRIILEDPRTSTPGLAFVLFADQIHGKKASAFWKEFRSQWLTLTPGWNEAYGLFLKGEAPLVWSYVTSQAYHRENPKPGSDPDRYLALILKEGNPIQVEGAALVKGSGDETTRKNARLFLEFLISDEVQKLIPKKNWMMPALAGVELPESFKSLPTPQKIISTDLNVDARAALQTWKQAIR